MDRFAEQFFGRSDKDNSKSSRSGAGDTKGIAEQMLHSFVSSAYERAMTMNERDATRGGAGGAGGAGGVGFDVDDFRTLGGFVVEMVKGRGDKDERRRNKEERRRKKEKKRRQREKEKERELQRDVKNDWGINTGIPYVPKYTKGRRRSSQSPLHVKFAEPLEDFDYPPPQKPRRRRRHRRDEEEDSHERDSRRRERRRSRRHGAKINLQSLKTELEDMSSTIISLNARSANHRDCEFYDKFVRKGGALQDMIGSTLGQIRGWEQDGGGNWYRYEHENAYDEDRRERKERKRRRREKQGWW